MLFIFLFVIIFLVKGGEVMIFLKSIDLISEVTEGYILSSQLRIYNGNYYPFGILSQKALKHIDFDNVTIFYGGNGSGKTTLLNIIALKANASRKSNTDKGMLFHEYVDRCEIEYKNRYDCLETKLITSDDVFDFLLDVRAINSNVNRRKEALAKGYFETKYGANHSEVSIDNYEELKRRVDAKKMTTSKYIRENLVNNTLDEQSNGESALLFWQKEINENGVYILDEPENSLSAENQLKLKKFIEDSARFYNCQFIISTHSPFLLSIDEAKVYDLDSNPVETKNWYELNNVRIYHDFFKEHDNLFTEKDKN